MRKKLLILGISLLLVTSNVFAAWDPTRPVDDELTKDVPALIRANWAAIAAGTDPALQITNEKVSATADIVDTKLHEIGTANKVNATAFKNLSGTPVGAGVFPAANIPDIDGAKLIGLANIDAGAGAIPDANMPSTVVKTSGDQTIAGIKTFSSIPVLPASDPTSDNQATRKAFVTNASNLSSGTIPTARIDTGTTANKIVQLDGSAKLPAVDGSQLTGLSTVTQANDVETTGVACGNGTDATVLSVDKTIASGKTVLLIASGYLVFGYYQAVNYGGTMKLKYSTTTVQSVVLQSPQGVQSSPGYVNMPWSLCAIITGLSGSTTFTVTGVGNQFTPYAYGNLIVLEF